MNTYGYTLPCASVIVSVAVTQGQSQPVTVSVSVVNGPVVVGAMMDSVSVNVLVYAVGQFHWLVGVACGAGQYDACMRSEHRVLTRGAA